METNSQDSEALKALGVRIRSLRSAQGLSQGQLADSAGMSARYLGEVEAGKRNVSFGRLSVLAQRLSIPLSELLDFEESATRAAVLQQLHFYLEGLPLNHLMFLQRILRMFRDGA
jgi:transcriptional regulator with XRE-family HTH domain